MTQTYNVYQDSVKVKEGVTAPPTDITGLSPATEYKFQVSSVLNGVESELSESLTVSTKAIEGQGNLVNNFSVSGNLNRWSMTNGTPILETVPFVDGTSVKALASNGEANQLIKNDFISLDSAKMYEISIWALSEANVSNGFYFGIETSNELVIRVKKVTGAFDRTASPYFLSDAKAPLTWTKYVGYFAPTGTSASSLRDAGLNINDNFIQLQESTDKFSLRALNFPTTKPRKMWFANPSIFEVNPDQSSTNH